MKRFILSIIAMVMTTLTIAAADTSAQATKILDKAAAKVNIKNGAVANFTINGGKLGNKSGSISIKGNKFNARTDNAIMWFDGKTQWLYNKKSNEVNVSTPSAAQQQSMNPYTFLTLYKQGYSKSMEKTASGNYNIHLTGKGKPIGEMYILIDNAYNIKQVKMLQNGQWITITISNLKAKNINDAAFKFNAKDFPKSEVIDLR